jgi:hypothetical protein
LTVLALSLFEVLGLGVLLLACVFLFFGLVEVLFSTGGIVHRLLRGSDEPPLPTLEPPGLSELDREAVRAPIKPPLVESTEPEAPPSEEEQKNKRASRRRATYKIPVEILDVSVPGEPFKGWVLDRSNNGMRLEIPQNLAVGTILHVRNADHASSAPWVQVEVRNCVVKANQWRAGCRFTHPQPAEVLLFFG